MRFDVHGVTLALEGPAQVLDPLARDFAWFAAPGEGGEGRADVEIRASLSDPPPLPLARARMQLPASVVYDAGGARWVDYHSQARVRLEGDRAEAWGRDPVRLAEIVYLLALSRIGERHDRLGLHRLHALAFSLHGRTCAVLLPEGGGKSTLALALLANPEVRLLSEDTPLVAPGGRILPFPLRIAVRDGTPLPFPAEHVRTFTRARHGTKQVLDLEAFRDRIGEAAVLTDLLVGLRSTGEPGVEPLPALALLPALSANLVFGLGLPQVVEYFLRGGLADVPGKSGIAFSRFGTALGLLRRARLGRLVLGTDAAENARTVSHWVETGC